MKRLILVTAIALGLMVIVAGLAFANGGPHGGYTPTTDACAGCHRAHSAIGPNLLMEDGTYALCVTCHGSAGAGANTNVDDGLYLSTRDDSGGNGNVGAANTPDNAALLGGGFVNYKGAGVTSNHDPSGTTAAAWGNGVARGVTAALVDGNLSCASCHDPHGSSVYRIMNDTVNTAAVTAVLVDEGTAKDYDTEQWGAGMSSICIACHSSYHVTRGDSATNNSNDGSGNLDYGGDVTSFAHRVDMSYSHDGNVNPETVGYGGYQLPLAETGVNDSVVCMTCHLPHGTSAPMTGVADAGGPPGATGTNDSALLRLPNRGVCEVCHQK